MKGELKWMDTKEFKKKFEKETAEFDELEFKRIIRQGIKRNGETLTNVITMEELSELQKEVSKKTRYKPSDNYDLIQEMSDALICIGNLCQQYNINADDLKKGINVKIKRINKKNKEYFEKFGY